METVRILKEKKLNIVIGIMAIFLISSLPYLYSGTPKGTSLLYYLNLLEPDWLLERGYKLVNLYNVYAVSLNLVTVLISYYCFSKMFRNLYIGLLCSSLYTLSIFRIYKMFVLSSMGEVGAMAFLPLIFYGLYRIYSEDINKKEYKAIWIQFAIGFTGLILTHIVSFLITALITCLLGMILFIRRHEKEPFVEIVKGLGSSFILNTWYIFPLFGYYLRNRVVIQELASRSIQEKGVYLPQLFLNWWRLGNNADWNEAGMRFSQPVGIGFIFGVIFFFFAIMWFSEKLKEKNSFFDYHKIMLILGGICMFMSLNMFPWDKIQNMNKVFRILVGIVCRPDVFLGIATVCLACVTGAILRYFLYQKQNRYFYWTCACILLSLITSSLYLIDHICRDLLFVRIYSKVEINMSDIIKPECLEQSMNIVMSQNGIIYTISGFVSCFAWLILLIVGVKKLIIIQKEKREGNDAIAD